MTDLVERLRGEARIFRKHDLPPAVKLLTCEAAAEIERLRAGGCARDQGTTQYCAEAAKLAAEIEKLRAALRKIIADCSVCGGTGCVTEYEAITDKYLRRDCRLCENARAALEGRT